MLGLISAESIRVPITFAFYVCVYVCVFVCAAYNIYFILKRYKRVFSIVTISTQK